MISRLKWHDLKSVHPVSNLFGMDRGTPIDRFYIEKFLIANAKYIVGDVLEIADDKYSRKFGSLVKSFEILHIEDGDNITIVGDLTKHETLPSNKIDCFICTQVFNFIYDFNLAIEGAHKLLRPGGYILATVSGISQISQFDATKWGHFWNFCPQGIERSFKNVFGNDNVDVNIFGNSLTAISFLKGIAMEELTFEELEYTDPDFPVTITIRATKPI